MHGVGPILDFLIRFHQELFLSITMQFFLFRLMQTVAYGVNITSENKPLVEIQVAVLVSRRNSAIAFIHILVLPLFIDPSNSGRYKFVY